MRCTILLMHVKVAELFSHWELFYPLSCRCKGQGFTQLSAAWGPCLIILSWEPLVWFFALFFYIGWRIKGDGFSNQYCICHFLAHCKNKPVFVFSWLRKPMLLVYACLWITYFALTEAFYSGFYSGQSGGLFILLKHALLYTTQTFLSDINSDK